MSKPSYEELASLICRVGKTTRVESALGVEWANYPVEVFDEVIDAVIELELPEDEDNHLEEVKPGTRNE